VAARLSSRLVTRSSPWAGRLGRGKVDRSDMRHSRLTASFSAGGGNFPKWIFRGFAAVALAAMILVAAVGGLPTLRSAAAGTEDVNTGTIGTVGSPPNCAADADGSYVIYWIPLWGDGLLAHGDGDIVCTGDVVALTITTSACVSNGTCSTDPDSNEGASQINEDTCCGDGPYKSGATCWAVLVQGDAAGGVMTKKADTTGAQCP
jgi:hypothetical protein